MEKDKNTLNDEHMYNIDRQMSRVPECMRLFMSEEVSPLSERRA